MVFKDLCAVRPLMCMGSSYSRNLHGCGITDDDVDVGDLAACFDDVGRKNIVTL